MISCPKCGKENQDHYKFCLGCGNELPRDGGGARPFRPTPPAAMPAVDASRRAGPAPNTPAPMQLGPAPAGGGFNPVRGPTPPPVLQPGMQPGMQPGAQPAPFSAPLAEAAPGPFGPAGGGFAPVAQPVAQPVAIAQGPVAMIQPAPASPIASPGAGPITPTPPEKSFPGTCPQCLSPNPRNNRFCITCGFDMANAPPAQMPNAPPGASPGALAGQQPAPMPMPPVVVAPVASPVAQGPLGPLPSAGFGPEASGGQGSPGTVPYRAPAAALERARLVLIRPDGTEGGSFPLNEGETRIGRDVGGIFAQDNYLSPRHSTFLVQGPNITVRDDNALNGLYIRIERQQPVEIRDGDMFRIGQEILRYEAFRPVTPEADGTEWMGSQVEGLVGRIALVIGRESFGNGFPIPITGLYLGRERGDILFPEDGYVSGLHCQLSVTGGRLMLVDVGSSNGTYLRIKGSRAVKNGDFLLMGQQLFRLTVL